MSSIMLSTGSLLDTYTLAQTFRDQLTSQNLMLLIHDLACG